MDKLVDHLFIFEGDGEIFDFPGNYSDYRSSVKMQELEDAKIKAIQQSEKTKQTLKNTESAGTRKLSFKEKKELEQLETELEILESEKNQIESDLSSGVLKSEELVLKSNRIGVVMKLIDEKTDRWLELSSI
jgi:ATP-binding cassette subfamily F protein uup